MDIAYVQKLQKWVELDNKLLKNKEDIKDIIQERKELEEDVLEYVEKNKYDRLTVNITDGTIKFGKRNVSQPLSMKTVRGILEKYNTEKNSIDVADIMKFLSENLETKQKVMMRREFADEASVN
jgi:L-asparaginase/Glu-tRNA(Gln) amidotransferase subunit D